VVFALELVGAFVLISDERSPTFSCSGPQGQRGLLPFLLSLMPPPRAPVLPPVTIQQVVCCHQDIRAAISGLMSLSESTALL